MRLPFASTFCACALFAFDASASMPTDGSTLIVQQRTADGRTLLTDRPLPGATIERRWSVPGAAPAVAADRSEGAYAYSGVPRHIDAQWRPLGEDPGRERVVRLTLERERLHRLAHRLSPSQREPGYRGPAGP